MKDPKQYYDDFSRTYDAHRGYGYHALLDELETEFLQRYARRGRVLEVGCGTGLILSRIRSFAPRAVGIDLSLGMLGRARDRGHAVAQASATALPFPDRSFDLVYSFKVLPHVPDLDGALAEIERVLAEEGVAVLEFYNPVSLRGLWKRLRWWQVRVGEGSHDRQVYTEYHAPPAIHARVPRTLEVLGEGGAVVVTPHPMAHRLPVLGRLVGSLERSLLHTPLSRFAGFYLVALVKRTRSPETP